MYKVEVHIFYISTEPIFWVYNFQVTPVLSISWLFGVMAFWSHIMSGGISPVTPNI